jgi:hypothetical protein
MSSDTKNRFHNLRSHACAIDFYLTEYRGLRSEHTVEHYIQNFSDDFLKACCPEALQLPAVFIADETRDEAFIGIHISQGLADTLSSHQSLGTLLNNREGLNAFLILAEEISHFHHYVTSADKNTTLSRFDLELQAEIEKVIVGSLALVETFGKSHTQELIHILFNESAITGQLTDYALASKIAEKFWKENIRKLGPSIVFDSRFRELIRQSALRNGDDKIRALETNILAA